MCVIPLHVLVYLHHLCSVCVFVFFCVLGPHTASHSDDHLLDLGMLR